MLRRMLLSLSRSTRIRHLVETAPISRSVVARFVAGTSAEEAVAAPAGTWCDSGRLASLDRLGEDTVERSQAEATRDAYLTMLKLLADEGLTPAAEVSVKLSAVGQSLPGDGEQIALDNALAICEAARNAGTTVTLDMEDHTTTDSTLGILRELRQRLPRHRCRACRPTCTARRPTAATSPTPGRAYGCARGPTRSRRRSPSRARTTWTGPTCAASRC